MADDVVVMYLGRVVEEGPVDDIFHAPSILTPSAAPLDSEHRVHAARQAATITGSIPHPYNGPQGWPVPSALPPVHARTCDASEPGLVNVREAAKVSCFLYQDGRKTKDCFA